MKIRWKKSKFDRITLMAIKLIWIIIKNLLNISLYQLNYKVTGLSKTLKKLKINKSIF